jgi:hypothetical protein
MSEFSEPTCLVCCFSELALKNSACWSSTKQTTPSVHQKPTCSCNDIAEILLTWCETKINKSAKPLKCMYVMDWILELF